MVSYSPVPSDSDRPTPDASQLNPQNSSLPDSSVPNSSAPPSNRLEPDESTTNFEVDGFEVDNFEVEVDDFEVDEHSEHGASGREDVIAENIARTETQVTDNLDQLLEILPERIRQVLLLHPQTEQLVEVVLDLGRRPEARFPGGAEYLSEDPISRADLEHCVDRVGLFSGDNRAGIERTLHRISAMRNRAGEVVGLTCRVGRAIFGTIGMIHDLVETGQSILMLGRPGVGKTTALREIARVLADDLNKRVVIIDTSNEIAGDGDIPHPAIGRARRMQVARPELQHQVMIEAVENHMPEVIVIDEIGTELEAMAARTIAERGVQLVGTAHGNQIENLIKNPTLSDLVGGIQSVTLGDDEARRRGSQKTVLERKAPPTFEIAVEMQERQSWVVHTSVSQTVDSLLRGRQPSPEMRSVESDGSITRKQVLADGSLGPVAPKAIPPNNRPQAPTEIGWRGTGRMEPLPLGEAPRPGTRTIYPLPPSPTPIHRGRPAGNSGGANQRQSFSEMLEDSFERAGGRGETSEFAMDVPGAAEITPYMGPNGEDLPLHVYPYAVSHHQLEQVIQSLNLPIILTKDVSGADTILALRSQLKGRSKLRHMAHNYHVPIHSIKSNTMPQIVRALRRLLNMEDVSMPEEMDLNLFTAGGDDDELEALEEARLAVEQIVLQKGQPVELLPRSGSIRKMQHDLVEHYRLKSSSFGDEPNRRLRIYPA